MKIVCFSEIQWRYVRTRKQQILTRFPEDWEILFLSSVVRGRRNNFIPERDGRVVHVCIPVFKNFPQRAVRAVFSFPPFRFLWNILLYIWLNLVFIVTGFSDRDRVFYVSNIYYAAVLRLLGRSLLIYDCNDDPLGFPDTPRWAGGYFRRLVLSADILTAVSRGLAGKLEEAGAAEVHHIGNGVDYDLFSRSAATGVAEELKGLDRPIFGYVGAIAHWFDFELLDRIAGAFPSASIVLVGPVYEDVKAALSDIAAERGNVYLIGTKPYEELGAYMAAMDVCLIPLLVNELRRLADPNKLYEYAAAGRPIVTMKYSEDIESLGDIVYLAGSREEFVRKVGEACTGGADEERLKAFAKSRSWRSRADEMSALILERLG